MELQDYRPKIPNDESLYFHVLKRDNMQTMQRYLADESILNSTMKKGERVLGDRGMAFTDCDNLGNALVVGKRYTTSKGEIFIEILLRRGSLKAGADIKITGIIDGIDYIYLARVDNNGIRYWYGKTERSGFYSLKKPFRELEILEINDNDLITLEIYDPNDSGFEKLTLCFDWQKLCEFSKRAQKILLYDGILTRLLRMHSLRANVTTVSVI